MQVTRNIIIISDLSNWMDEKTLTINRKYQRSGGLWPINARSYFIDTIINGFPFPKVTIRQTVDLKTRKSIREIIDGQQRLSTINDYLNHKFTLTKVSNKYQGLYFDDLTDEEQQNFLSYEVSVDTVVAGTEDEVLEIFRRINSYTLPLNEPEKRHATYQGEFKWFILKQLEKFTPLIESSKVLNTRSISRMEDAELLTELIQIIDEGILTRSNPKLEGLYKKYDNTFSEQDSIAEILDEVMNFIKIELSDVCSSNVLKKYSFYSLFSALMFNKWGLKKVSSSDIANLQPQETFTNSPRIATQNILELFEAVDLDDDKGRFAEFVKANKRATGNLDSRKVRLKWLVAALQGSFENMN